MAITTVYVVRSDTALSKIGRSDDPYGRLRVFRLKFKGKKLDFAFVGECPDRKVAAAIEQRAHRILAHKREKGEWFSVGPDEAVKAVKDAAAELGQTLRPYVHNKPTMDQGKANVLVMIGTQTALAKLLGLSHAQVSRWQRIPLRHITALETAGIPRHAARPDIWRAPA